MSSSVRSKKFVNNIVLSELPPSRVGRSRPASENRPRTRRSTSDRFLQLVHDTNKASAAIQLPKSLRTSSSPGFSRLPSEDVHDERRRPDRRRAVRVLKSSGDRPPAVV